MLIPISLPIRPETNPADASVHRIFCIDCSGSMSSDLPLIIQQLKNKIPTYIRPQDYLSLIWFSGRDQYGTIFEHINIEDIRDVARIHQALDRYLRPVGSTGFVKPIELSKQLAEKYPQQPQVFFLTDGQENAWTPEECKTAFAQMVDIPLIIVEYQYSCDRSFLDTLGDVSHATNLFSEDFERYSETFETYMQNAVTNTNIVISSDKPIVYCENDVMKMKFPDTQNQIQIPETISHVYQYDPSVPFFSNQERDRNQSEVNLCYKMMLYGLQNRNPDIIQKCVNQLGDVYTTRLYANCFSKQDYAKMQEHVQACIQNPEESAYKMGVNLDYRVNEDAFNVIQMLKMLETDTQARFYPYHPSFRYNSISKKQENAVKFVATRELGSPFSLVYNKSRANISLGCRVYGYEIEDDSIRPATAYRNYAILKDGIKNVLILPMSMSESVFVRLQEEDCLDATLIYEKDKVYSVNITNLPVVNRRFARGNLNSREFCRSHIQLMRLKAEMKYLKARKNRDFSSQDDENDEDAPEYSRNVADPTVVRDFYMAPELQVKIAKCSSLPTVNDKLLLKLNSNGRLTVSEQLYENIHQAYENYSNMTREVVENWMMENKRHQEQLGEYMEQAKMALLVAGCWFSDASIEEKTFHVDGFDVSVDIQDVKVYMN